MLGPWPLSELVDSSAVALCVGEVWLTSGVAPPPRWLAEFARWLATQPRRRVATNSVSGAGFPGAAPPPAVAAGVLGAVVCEAPLVCLL
jgi:light-regulated signal transduction histidine kinase (bacteriophytochrome)